ncbi:MAG: hypothetical protein ACFFBS_10320, partial [Promethearchaeota archaeon]
QGEVCEMAIGIVQSSPASGEADTGAIKTTVGASNAKNRKPDKKRAKFFLSAINPASENYFS